jgi:hypothetical protein
MACVSRFPSPQMRDEHNSKVVIFFNIPKKMPKQNHKILQSQNLFILLQYQNGYSKVLKITNLSGAPKGSILEGCSSV